MTRVQIFPGFILLLLLAIVVVFVLISLFSKRGSLAAVIILVVLACMALAHLFLGVSHQRVVPVSKLTQTQRSYPRQPAPDRSVAIWRPGVENAFEANIYPSKLSAVRSLGLQIGRPIRDLLGDQDWPDRGLLFKGGHDQALLDEFIKAAQKEFPRTYWTAASEAKGLQPDEIGIRLDLSAIKSNPAPWIDGSGIEITSGTFRASVLAGDGDKQKSIAVDYVEKPWIENFYGVWNHRPNKRLIIAKSTESCLTGQEAEQQAIANACSQLTQLLRQTRQAKASPSISRKVKPNDVQESGFILDRFSQKFEGRAGEIWRHALLIDASHEKMEQFAKHNIAVVREMRSGLAKMIFSVLGLLALITVAYVFLNAATKGYYTWSLRIAGIALAVVVILLVVA